MGDIIPEPYRQAFGDLLATASDPDERATEELLDFMGLAWAEVEAAMPEGWRLLHLAPCEVGDDNPLRADWKVAWVAEATPQPLDVVPGYYNGFVDDTRDGYGPTPAAALRALAAKLRSGAA